MKKIVFTLFVYLCLTFFVTGQSAINHPLGDLADGANQTISYKGSRNYKFTERSDLRVYKNGHADFDIFLTPGTGARSYIYVREKDRIIFYNVENAQTAWTWQKKIKHS